MVIPVYQHSAFLAQALESIAKNTHSRIEVVIVDDGSEPPISQDVTSSGMVDIRLVHQEHAGAAAARNHGVAESRFDTIMFLDADDLWVPGKIDFQLERYREDPGSLHFGWVEEFLDPSVMHQNAGRPQARKSTAPTASTLCCSRSQFEEHGGFNQDLRTGEFIEWLLRLQRAGVATRSCPEVLALRRVHAGNRDRRSRPENSDYAKILREHLSRNTPRLA